MINEFGLWTFVVLKSEGGNRKLSKAKSRTSGRDGKLPS